MKKIVECIIKFISEIVFAWNVQECSTVTICIFWFVLLGVLNQMMN